MSFITNLFTKQNNQAASTKTNGDLVYSLAIKGMHCVSCSLMIDSTLEEIPGVSSSETNYATGTATVKANSSVKLNQLIRAISQLGYSVDKKLLVTNTDLFDKGDENY